MDRLDIALPLCCGLAALAWRCSLRPVLTGTEAGLAWCAGSLVGLALWMLTL